ncbi:MAG: hypothetical protein L3J92_00625 [Thermoplasmata archaeon]|jgi:hypothetical protein|nr:hypothetical protein [Thermoplasmata archaeon]
MNASLGLRRTTRRRSLFRRRGWAALVALALISLTLGAAVALPLQVTHLTETLVGIRAPAQFLVHWQQVGSEAGTVPAPTPGVWSVGVGTPSRLPRFSGDFAINTVVSGDVALLWVFNETVGIATGTELEVSFHIQYSVGAVTTSVAITSYIETQRRALVGPLAFTVYWDSGYTAGVSFVNQLEVAQACTAVGVCP